VLSRYQPKPGRHLTTVSELMPIADRRDQRRGDHRTDAGHGLEALIGRLGARLLDDAREQGLITELGHSSAY